MADDITLVFSSRNSLKCVLKSREREESHEIYQIKQKTKRTIVSQLSTHLKQFKRQMSTSRRRRIHKQNFKYLAVFSTRSTQSGSHKCCWVISYNKKNENKRYNFTNNHHACLTFDNSITSVFRLQQEKPAKIIGFFFKFFYHPEDNKECPQ